VRIVLGLLTALLATYWWVQRIVQRRRWRATRNGGKYRTRQARPSDLQYIASSGDKAFGSARFGGFAGRIDFVNRILDVDPNSFWILEHRQNGENWDRVGYVGAFVEQPPVFIDHLTGRRCQYSLASRDLVRPAEVLPRCVQPGIYVQAVVVDAAHRDSMATNSVICKGVMLQLAALLQRSESEEFYLLGEGFTAHGCALMEEYGFEDTGRVSATGHPLFLFDSKSATLPVRGSEFVAGIKAIRRARRPRAPQAA
jgi:hypothetical protein